MKNGILAIVGFALLAAVAAPAQTLTRQTGTFKVPFAFRVGDKTLPAAEYRVDLTNSGLVRLIANNGFGASTITTNADLAPSASRALRFERAGNTWILKQVTLGGHVQKPVLTRSEQAMVGEAQLAQANNPQPAEAVVASIEAVR
jgi:hypothetical protein